MSYGDTRQTLRTYREKIEALRREMRDVQAKVEPEVVEDYEFVTPHGPIRLSQLFGDKSDLFVVHNMGTKCSSCTMWADGFNGVYPHLAERAAFVVISSDPPDVQRRFAGDRGWRFPMASSQNSSFHVDMGMSDAGEPVWPGISAFQKRDGRIVRVSDAELGPGDDFCVVYHFLDLLPEGVASFRPKFRYHAA